MVGSGEYMVEHPTLPDKHPEVATMFNLAPQEPLELAAKLVPPGGAGIGMHVIPVEKAIDASSTSVSVEHLSHWIDKYDTFCSMVCACRKAQRIRGEGVGDIEGHMCIGVGDIAEFLVTSGKDARYISKEFSAVQHTEYVPKRLPCPCGSEKMRSVRKMCGSLSRRSCPARTEAVPGRRPQGHISDA